MSRELCAKVFAVVLFVLLLAPGQGMGKMVGKNPGKIKGRWLELQDGVDLGGYKGVYIGETKTDIQWKRPENEAPIDEDLLDEYLREQVVLNLRQSRVLGEVLESAPEKGAKGYVRLDCDLTVEPGSRAMRYVVGFGAGKSRSILEIRLRDHKSGDELALYHGYGVGSGMGFKLAGGGARKMTQDDVEENTQVFVELLAQVK